MATYIGFYTTDPEFSAQTAETQRAGGPIDTVFLDKVQALRSALPTG